MMILDEDRTFILSARKPSGPLMLFYLLVFALKRTAEMSQIEKI